MKGCKVKFGDIYADVTKENSKEYATIKYKIIDGYETKKVHKDELIIIGYGDNKIIKQ